MSTKRVHLLYCGVQRSIAIGGQVVSSILPEENIGDHSVSWHLMDALAIDASPGELEWAARDALTSALAWAAENDLRLNLTLPLDTMQPRGPGAAIRFGVEALLVDRISMRPVIRAFDPDNLIDLRAYPDYLPEQSFGSDIHEKLAILDDACAIESSAEAATEAKASPRI